MGDRRGVRHDAVQFGLLLVDHETAADRVVVALEGHLAVPAQGAEAHAVGVQRQLFALVEREVLFLVEGDFPGTMKANGAGLPDAPDGLVDGVRIDRVRRFACEPEHDRAVRSMAAPRVGQGPIKRHVNPLHAGEQFPLAQALDEGAGGAHGAHRVGTGRPDTDLEQFENADGHGSTLEMTLRAF